MARLGVRLAQALIALLGSAQPDSLARCGAWLGTLTWSFGLRRRVVADNLKRAFPAWDGGLRRVTGRAAYQTIGANFFQVWSRDVTAHSQGIRLLNPLSLQHWAQQYRGRLVLLAMHHANWEATPIPISAVDPTGRVLVFAKRQGVFDDLLNEARERLPMQVILAGGSGRRTVTDGLRALRQGRPLGMIADQGPRSAAGVPVWFLGQPTYAFPGPAVLAQRAQGAMIPVVSCRLAGGRAAMVCLPPIQAGKDQSVDELVQQGCNAMSAIIQRFPAQYFWHHRRFKHRSKLSGTSPRVSSLMELVQRRSFSGG